MSRSLRIVLILIFIVIVLLTGAWLFSRKQSKESGQPTPTFREFLGFGTRPTTQSPGGGSGLSPDTQDQGGTTTPGSNTSGNSAEQGIDSSQNSVTVSQFTSGPLTPASSPLTSQNNQAAGGTPSPGGSGSSSSNTTTPASPTSSSSTSSTTPGCSDADVNISFTADEINRLNALQNRFYAIAQSLRTDSDVTNELANYTAFRTKADTVTELYNYCQSRAPLIQAPEAYKNRIATPFWRDPARDVRGYIIGSRPFSSTSIFSPDDSVIDPRNVVAGQSILERIFRLNLW